MRLNELIDTEFKTTELPTKFNTQKLLKQKEKGEKDPEVKKRSGAYAKVDVDPDEPFTAKKKYHVPMKDVEDDGYYVYIKTIADRGLAKSNPYFPRVYNVDIEKDKTGKVRPEFKMETLISSSELDAAALYGMGDRMFENFEYMLPVKDPDEKQLRHAIAHGIIQILKYGSFERVKDPKLMQALSMIRNIVLDGDTKYGIDMHPDNYMIRPTPHGPQLVLTDPISDKQTRG